MLITAGVNIPGSLSVVGVVEQLKKLPGWRVSRTPAPGAVAFTNEAYGNGGRSHIGIVGSDGYNVINNSGRTMGITRPWSSRMLYLIPPA